MNKRKIPSLNTQILAGALFGIAVGFLMNSGVFSTNAADKALYIFTILGGLFIDSLKMILIPLVFSSIAVGIANLQAHAQMNKVWKYALVYFLATTAISVFLGLFLVNLFKPGQGLHLPLFQGVESVAGTKDMSLAQFVQTFLGNILVNPLAAMSQGQVLPTVIFAVLFGIAIVMSGERAQTTKKVLNEIFEIIMIMVNWIMKFAPLGVMALLAKLVAGQNLSFFSSLGKFVGVVIFGTLFHGIVTLPAILFAFTGMKPFEFFNGMKEALVTAFSTSSSSATLPISLKCLTQNLKVDKDIAGFVAPLGATINMDGTALYEAVAAIFIANIAGIHLNVIQQVIVFFTAILASVGAPGIPSAGMVTMVMVLQSVGLPAEGIAILLPIDRFLDAIRTAVNVQGDATGSLVIQNQITRKPST